MRVATPLPVRVVSPLGRRRVEITRLRWDDVDLDGGTHRYTRKGGHREKRPLFPVLRDATLAYAQRCTVPTGPEWPVFPGFPPTAPFAPQYVTRLIGEALCAGGITTSRPVHALRHSLPGCSVRSEQGSRTSSIPSITPHRPRRTPTCVSLRGVTTPSARGSSSSSASERTTRPGNRQDCVMTCSI